MMRSLFSGVSGLKSHQTRMDVIGNNIANVNTTGFKSSRTTFADTLSQTLSGASAPKGTVGGTNPKQVGLGTGVASIDILFTDGSSQSTGKNTDLALSGNGTFVVKNGNETYYTRDGAFEFDSEGNYVLPGSGLYVQGWTNTGTDNTTVNTNGAVGNIQVVMGKSMAAKATEEATYNYNLNSSTPIVSSYTFTDGNNTVQTQSTLGTYIKATTAQPVTLTMSDGTKQTVTSGIYTVGRSLPITTTVTFYDSLGGKHTAALLWQKNDTSTVTYKDPDTNKDVTKTCNNWTIYASPTKIKEDDGSTTTLTWTQATVSFDEDGVQRAGKVSGTMALTEDANTAAKCDATTDIIPTARTTSSVANATLTATHSSPSGSSTNEITIDFSKLTQFSGNSTINATADGYAAGVLKSVAIDSSGTIQGTYTNGERRAEAQVAVAQFTNASGLTKTGNSLYQTSNNSGEANVKTATDLGVTITPSSLEMSNVDIANEFSDMIITQRGFQSNSKIITVGDEMLETLINMKR